jgi:hypothetical protein
MPTDLKEHARRRRGRGLRPWLIQAKFLGLVGVLGAAAALGAMGVGVAPPTSMEGWLLLREAMRSIFWPCFFGGIILTSLAGVALWLQHPREFTRMRWFRVKALLLAIGLPSLHLWSRGRITAFYEAIDEARVEELPALWHAATTAFLVALAVLFGISVIGRVKPRLGERVGWRATKRRSDEGGKGSGGATVRRRG